MKITSPVFRDAGTIPVRHTCDGEDLSPPLAFDEVPEGARSLALVVDDPDAPAGLWDHWVIWNLPPDTRELPEGWGNGGAPEPAATGLNSWGEPGWRGPCPPSGVHRYDFYLFALDQRLELGPGTTGSDLRAALSGHLLGQAELEGRYGRTREEG